MQTIVVIDDDEGNNKLLKTVLKEYEVYTAHNAEVGIDLIRRVQPHLVLLDIRMPGIDGVAAIQIIRGDDAINDIPIIAVSAIMSGAGERAIEAGCDDFVAKPFKPNELKALIKKFI